MPEDRLPDFVIIGAAKSATTWLAYHLQQHRQIFVPNVEVHYFSRHHAMDAAWYAAHFRGARAGQVVGERSNTYLTCPEAPRRLKTRLPDARLIVQLRNPIERAYSDYCMHLRRGTVTPDVDLYLDVERSPLPHLLDTGLYYRNLSRFLEELPAERMLVLLYDDVAANPTRVLHDVCAHIGVDADGARSALVERVYDKRTPEIEPWLRALLRPLRRVGARHRHKAWFRAMRSCLGPLPSYPDISKATRDRLGDFYRDDVRALSMLLGRDLLPWLSPATTPEPGA